MLGVSTELAVWNMPELAMMFADRLSPISYQVHTAQTHWHIANEPPANFAGRILPCDLQHF